MRIKEYNVISTTVQHALTTHVSPSEALQRTRSHARAHAPARLLHPCVGRQRAPLRRRRARQPKLERRAEICPRVRTGESRSVGPAATVRAAGCPVTAERVAGGDYRAESDRQETDRQTHTHGGSRRVYHWSGAAGAAPRARPGRRLGRQSTWTTEGRASRRPARTEERAAAARIHRET